MRDLVDSLGSNDGKNCLSTFEIGKSMPFRLDIGDGRVNRRQGRRSFLEMPLWPPRLSSIGFRSQIDNLHHIGCIEMSFAPCQH